MSADNSVTSDSESNTSINAENTDSPLATADSVENNASDNVLPVLKLDSETLKSKIRSDDSNEILNEIIKMLTPEPDQMDCLTERCIVAWIKKSDVLKNFLEWVVDDVIEPQSDDVLDALVKIIRLLIKQRALSLEELDAVVQLQFSPHLLVYVYFNIVHNLLVNIAYDLAPEHIDHLFETFYTTMITANQWQLERLLVLIRRLTTDDKNGVMFRKTLDLFWQLAHSDEIYTKNLDETLAVIVEIMKNFCSQRGDSQKNVWLNRCADEFESAENCVLPALRLMREIYCLSDAVSTQNMLNRKQVILRLNRDYSFVSLVVNNLTTYMGKVRAKVIEMNNVEPYVLRIDGRYPHETQIKERLNFIKFALQNGQLWLHYEDADKIWRCLALNAVISSDREACFRFFNDVMDEDFEPGCHKQFFEKNILQLDP